MQLPSIYNLVSSDLSEVENIIISTCDVDSPEHRKMLEHCLTNGGKRRGMMIFSVDAYLPQLKDELVDI